MLDYSATIEMDMNREDKRLVQHPEGTTAVKVAQAFGPPIVDYEKLSVGYQREPVKTTRPTKAESLVSSFLSGSQVSSKSFAHTYSRTHTHASPAARPASTERHLALLSPSAAPSR